MEQALREQGVYQRQGGEECIFADEFRVSLHGPVRRVWAPRGEEIRQRVDVGNAWAHVLVGANPLTGTLRWAWLSGLQGDHFAAVLQQWRESGVGSIVWDGFGPHRDKKVKSVGIRLIEQPPYSPELNPVERIGEELRAHLEGEVYGTVERKRAAADALFRKWADDPARIRRLTCWQWIHRALTALADLSAKSG